MIHHKSIGYGGTVDVWSWKQQKQALEVQLAWELVDVFSSELMLGPLNKKCLDGIEEMYYTALDRKGLSALQKALNKESKLALVQKYFRGASKDERLVENAFQRIIQAARDGGLDLNECCEFIRFYGEFGEQAKGVGIGKYAQADGARQQYKKNGGDEGGVWGKKSMEDLRKSEKLLNRTDPQKPLIQPKQVGGRQRTLLHKQDEAKINPEHKRRYMEFGPVREFLRSMGGGMDVWIEKESSTIQKINMMFGLTSGADISGTTTDTAWYIDQFALGRVSPIYYLLPLSYIVAVGHHTILEVGAALTVTERAQSQHLRPLNVHYSIGSYVTLLPGLLGDIPQKGTIAADIHPVSAGARAVKEKLGIAQVDSRNKFLLFYYSQQSAAPAGCIEFNEPEDIRLFKKMATLSPWFLAWFRSMSFIKPSWSDVSAFISYFGGRSTDYLTARGGSVRSGMLYATIAHTRRTSGPRIGRRVDVMPYDAKEMQGKERSDRMLRSMSGKRQFIPLTIEETERFERGQFKPNNDIIRVSGKYWIQTD